MIDEQTNDTTDTAETRDQMRQRAEDCGKEIHEVLTRHRCRIIPYLTTPEPVGQDGSRAIIGAAFGVFPIERT